MKLKDFLKQFDGYDPELEVGTLGCTEYFHTHFELKMCDAFVINNLIVRSKREECNTIKILDIRVL